MAEEPKRIYSTKREVKTTASGCKNLGQLDLPVAKPEDTETMEVSGLTITARFGSLFEGLGHWVPVIPHYKTGVIYNRWLELHRAATRDRMREESSGDIEVIPEPEIKTIGQRVSVSTLDKDRPLVILFRYDRAMNKLDEDIEEMASAVPPGTILAFPPIGVNNGMTYFQSAFRLLYSVLACLQNEGSALFKLRSIVFICPFEDDGARVIQHIFNLMRIHNSTRNEPDCVICATMKEDTLLSCGHRFCIRCVLSITDHVYPPVCPACRMRIGAYLPCYKLAGCQEFKCCKEPKGEKQAFIFLPCGHHSALCTTCHENQLALRTQRVQQQGMECPVCKEPTCAYMRFYQNK
jgi:hypothetical protein